MSECKKRQIAQLKATDSVLAGKSKCTEEMPVHNKLDGKLAWNLSNAVTKADIEAWYRKVQTRAHANSTARMVHLESYTPPHMVRDSCVANCTLLES